MAIGLLAGLLGRPFLDAYLAARHAGLPGARRRLAAQRRRIPSSARR